MNAVILAHYYQESEIQDLADFVGDSLQLSQQAAATKADVIVFAGVLFMAETAKILNPTKLVLLPDLKAGCSLADGCPAELFKTFCARYPDHLVISYINCSAGSKGAQRHHLHVEQCRKNNPPDSNGSAHPFCAGPAPGALPDENNRERVPAVAWKLHGPRAIL